MYIMVLVIRANTFQEGQIDYLASGSSELPAVRFTQDADTGLYRPGPNTLGFSTGGQTAMQIDSSGNVEITGFITANGLVRSMTVTSVAIVGGGTLVQNSSADCLVSGSGFLPDDPFLVMVGGTNAIATTRIDEATLQVTVPPQPVGTYDLSVIRRRDGASVTLPTALTYHDQALEMVTATDLGSVQINTAFSITIETVSSNPTIEYANLTTLPPACSLDPSTGEIAGTITTAETLYSFTIQATDNTTSNTTTKTFLLHTTAP